ncbi:hypothetical protein ACFLZP_02995, partial [Patescibacteria group bacterium]
MVKKKDPRPLTEKTLQTYAKALFEPIKQGESVTAVWVPMAGRRMITKYIIYNLHLFSEILPDPDQYLMVYVEPLDLVDESLTGYLRLMGLSFIEVCKANSGCKLKLEKHEAVFRDEKIAYAALLGQLKEMIQEAIEQNLEVVFFLGEFDELSFANKIFCNNLKSFWASLRPALHYVFLMRENITASHLIKGFGELAEAILQNVFFVPLLSDQDVDYLINLFGERLQTKFGEFEKKAMVKICGSHPFLLKVACR